jgi:hypothetical protein
MLNSRIKTTGEGLSCIYYSHIIFLRIGFINSIFSRMIKLIKYAEFIQFQWIVSDRIFPSFIRRGVKGPFVSTVGIQEHKFRYSFSNFIIVINWWFCWVVTYFFYNPSIFAICTKYNEQMGGNRNKRGGRELSSAHPYVGGARPGMVTGRSTN